MVYGTGMKIRAHYKPVTGVAKGGYAPRENQSTAPGHRAGSK